MAMSTELRKKLRTELKLISLRMSMNLAEQLGIKPYPLTLPKTFEQEIDTSDESMVEELESEVEEEIQEIEEYDTDEVIVEDMDDEEEEEEDEEEEDEEEEEEEEIEENSLTISEDENDVVENRSYRMNKNISGLRKILLPMVNTQVLVETSSGDISGTLLAVMKDYIVVGYTVFIPINKIEVVTQL